MKCLKEEHTCEASLGLNYRMRAVIEKQQAYETARNTGEPADVKKEKLDAYVKAIRELQKQCGNVAFVFDIVSGTYNSGNEHDNANKAQNVLQNV